MVSCVRYRSQILFFSAALILLLSCFLPPLQSKVQEEPLQPAKQETAQEKKDFPGRSEIIPQATVIASRMAEAFVQVQKAENLAPVYKNLDNVKKKVEKLEEQYANWEEVGNWRMNRLRMAESAYAGLREQQKGQLALVQSQLQIMEDLQGRWEEERVYWQKWQENLDTKEVAYPAEVFERIRAGMDQLLARITKVYSELFQAQLKYAPDKVIIANRLITISNTLESIRRQAFHRNSYSLFEPDFYRQFNRELFSDFATSLVVTLWSPKEYLKLKDKGWTIVLQIFLVFIIARLLIYRRKQSRPIAEEWRFLFARPLTAAIFINIIAIGNFTPLYNNLPPAWSWVLVVILTVVTLRLSKVRYLAPFEKKAVNIVAGIFIITHFLYTFGMPEPLLQLYDIFLCAAAILLCWRIILGRQEELLPRTRFLLYLILGLGILGLTTSMLGFERLASILVHATVSTLIFLLIFWIALPVVKGGIASFMKLEWIRKRAFMQVLGLEEATKKLQALFKFIILVNAVLVFLVIWRFFDSILDASQAIMGYEFTFGDLTLSIRMMVVVIVILYLTSLFSWLLEAFLDSQIMTPRKIELGIKESLKRLVHYGVFTLGFLIAVSSAGIELQNVTILAGALGVGIGFGLQNIVNNFVSGLILLFERPVKVGDIISINQDWGTITKIGLRSTVFATFDNSEIIVPNADLVAQKVTNWTFTSKMVRAVLPVGVAYGSPLEKVLEILNRAAGEHPDVLSYPAPNSIFEGFGSSSIDFQLRFWVRSIDERLRVRTEVAVIIDRLFREENIVIAFPQLDVHLHGATDQDLPSPKDESSPVAGSETEGIKE